jgi:hypothetical protein
LCGVGFVYFSKFIQGVVVVSHTYDTGNNLIHLSHQAKSNTWQQTLTIRPNSNRGTETQQSTSDFDANGNLLNLNNIGNLP